MPFGGRHDVKEREACRERKRSFYASIQSARTRTCVLFRIFCAKESFLITSVISRFFARRYRKITFQDSAKQAAMNARYKSCVSISIIFNSLSVLVGDHCIKN